MKNGSSFFLNYIQTLQYTHLPWLLLLSALGELGEAVPAGTFVEHSIKSGRRVGVESPPTGSSPAATGNCNTNILKFVFIRTWHKNVQTVREDVFLWCVQKPLTSSLLCIEEALSNELSPSPKLLEDVPEGSCSPSGYNIHARRHSQ
jgi:hypothetical protein